MTNRASEASCWALLALAQVHAGQEQPGIRSGCRALTLSKESKNVWVQIGSMRFLTYGLLDAGAYEEALGDGHVSDKGTKAIIERQLATELPRLPLARLGN